MNRGWGIRRTGVARESPQRSGRKIYLFDDNSEKIWKSIKVHIILFKLCEILRQKRLKSIVWHYYHRSCEEKYSSLQELYGLFASNARYLLDLQMYRIAFHQGWFLEENKPRENTQICAESKSPERMSHFKTWLRYEKCVRTLFITHKIPRRMRVQSSIYDYKHLVMKKSNFPDGCAVS